MNLGRFRTACARLALGLSLGTALLHGAQFQPGALMPDFAFDRHESDDVFHLSDFSGKVVLLDWFAHWCPICQQAAEPVRNLIQQFTAAGGNAHGVPVVLVSLNLVANEDAQTDAFIAAHGLPLVADDTSRSLSDLFRTGGQPIFAIINCVTGSPTHKPNELLLSYLGFDANSTIGTLQAAINSIKPPGAAAAPRIYSDLRSDEPISVGGTLTLRVDALGSPPLRFQWFKDGEPILTGPSDSWTITGATASDAGAYQVRVSNDEGKADSQVARVSVEAPPAFVAFQFDATHLAILGMRTKPGRTYQLLASPDLSEWKSLGEFIATGPTTAIRDNESAGQARRYYRLVER